MPPLSSASSEGSIGMVLYSYRIRGSVSRRDLRMIDLVLQEELRVRDKIIRDTSQCGRGESKPPGGYRVAVAMEGFNGWARPLDSMVRGRGYRLYNINNLKLARFKEIFPGAAKSDRIDARKGLELFQLRDHLPLAKEVLQEVVGTPHENEVLKRLSRRRRQLVDERVRVVNNLQADLQAVCPGLLEITKEAGNQWFLNFLISADTLPQLA